jgi:hypothetical protein
MGGLKAGMGHRGRIVVYILWMESSHWRYTNCQALKTNGANYNKTARYKQGEALHPGYGFIITAIASAKLSFMKRSPYCFSTIYKVL